MTMVKILKGTFSYLLSQPQLNINSTEPNLTKVGFARNMTLTTTAITTSSTITITTTITTKHHQQQQQVINRSLYFTQLKLARAL